MKKNVYLFLLCICFMLCSCGQHAEFLHSNTKKDSITPFPETDAGISSPVPSIIPATQIPSMLPPYTPFSAEPSTTHTPAPMEPSLTPSQPPATSSPAPTHTPAPVEPSLAPSHAPAPVEPSLVPSYAPAHVPDETPLPDLLPPVTTDLITPQNWYEHMINSSLLSTGTNGRLERFLQKLKNNEPVSIVAYGGSITEGAGAENFTYSYGDHFINSLLTTYPLTGSTYHNSGLGGTPSTLGLMRYQRDVTDFLQGTPDLVILEFAVNDYNDPTNGRAYESLIRTILTQDEDTAIILLFSVFENKWNLQDTYIPLGTYYGLPMISIKNAIAPAYHNGFMSDADFFADIYHPTNYGHEIMSDCLIFLLEQVAEKTEAETMPVPSEALYGADYYGMEFLDSTHTSHVQITPGSFSARDTDLQTFARTAQSAFPNNWMHSGDSGNEALRVELTCKNILLTYKLSSSAAFGKASVYLDGVFMTELNGSVNGAWNNTDTVLILDDSVTSSHVLEIVMSEGQEAKDFTVLGIGYTP